MPFADANLYHTSSSNAERSSRASLRTPEDAWLSEKCIENARPLSSSLHFLEQTVRTVLLKICMYCMVRKEGRRSRRIENASRLSLKYPRPSARVLHFQLSLTTTVITLLPESTTRCTVALFDPAVCSFSNVIWWSPFAELLKSSSL